MHRQASRNLSRLATLVFGVLLTSNPLVFAQSLTFAPLPSSIPYGNPTALVTGDFNGDGLADVAVVTGNYEHMLVELSNGDGTYRMSADVTACMTIYCAPFSMVAADFNRDGKLDIAIVDQYTNDLIVYLGKGDGTFQPPISFPSNSNHPSTIVSADFNGDGIPDIAYTNNSDNTVSVLLGNGDGTFGTQQNFQTGSSPMGLVAIDLNGDKSPDLAVVNSGDNTVSTLLNNGSAQFQAGATFNVGQSPTDITSADFNGDGKPDLAVTNTVSASVSVALGNGNGSFQTPATFAVGQSPTGIKTADINHDGLPDLVTINPGDGTVSILLGGGPGVFASQQAVAANTGTGGNPYTPHRIAVGNFTRNGYVDIVTTDAVYGQSPNIITTLVQIAPTDNDSGQTSTDNDSTLAQLSGGNNFAGNQAVNGSVTANSFIGNGSGLTGVNAASATTAYGLNCTGCVQNTMLASPSLTLNAGPGLTGGGTVPLGGAVNVALAPGACPPGFAVTLLPFNCSPFATLGPNIFNGQQSVSYTPPSNTTANAFQAENSGSAAGGVGIWGGYAGTTGGYGYGVKGLSNNGTGVIGTGTDSGVTGINSSAKAGAAGVFNNSASTDTGYILLGQYQGANRFIVDAKGDLTASGSLQIGGGTAISEYISTTLYVTLPAITSGACTTFVSSVISAFTPGTSDTIALGVPGSLLNLGTAFLNWQAWETSTSASPTITVRACNVSQSRYAGGASGTIRVDLFKH